jgi:hypothetical protein
MTRAMYAWWRLDNRTGVLPRPTYLILAGLIAAFQGRAPCLRSILHDEASSMGMGLRKALLFYRGGQ